MAQDNALNALHKQSSALTSAEEHLGDMIRTLSEMQEQANVDIQEGFENRNRFQFTAHELIELAELITTLPPEVAAIRLRNLASVAQDGANLETRQIERNELTGKACGAAIGLLQAIGGAISGFRQFGHTIARAFSKLLAD